MKFTEEQRIKIADLLDYDLIDGMYYTVHRGMTREVKLVYTSSWAMLLKMERVLFDKSIKQDNPYIAGKYGLYIRALTDYLTQDYPHNKKELSHPDYHAVWMMTRMSLDKRAEILLSVL